MPRFSAKLLCAVASSALLWSAPASAQSVDRIVAFGDSYADDGNLFELIGIDPPFVYPTGRFSGGTNFVDTMSTLLNAPVDNRSEEHTSELQSLMRISYAVFC